MEQKNTKGIIALIFALLTIALIVLAIIPMEPIRNTGVKLSGMINVIFSGAAFVCAIITLILGISAKKNTDKKGLGIFAMIVGILSIILSIFLGMGTCTLSLVSDYANHGKDSFIGKNITDKDQLDQIDKALDQILGEKK